MPKKLLHLSWECYQALSSVVEQLKSMPNLPNEFSNTKVQQEFELIMLDIDVTYVNIFINEPIKIVL